MITFFPQLYPGELLYSWFARYHNHSGNVSFKTTTKDLFGNSSHIAIPDLPCNLDYLCNEIQHFSPPDFVELIKKHTFFRYYTAFLSENVKETVMYSMRTGISANTIHMLIGSMASSIHDISFFRYCPTCVKENAAIYGEPYLHTIHQLPSCFICPQHGEILCNSSLPFRGYNKHAFKAFTKSDCTGIRVIQNTDERMLNILLAVAIESKYLIEKELHIDNQTIYKQHRVLLGNRGLISSNGHVRQKELSKAFISYFKDEILKLLQSKVNTEHESCWLKTITRKQRKTFHPIRHILLIHFLGETLESLVSIKHENNLLPFGNGPFPCLNKAASHYKKDVIPDITISICSKTKLPIGSFSCDCGFIYSRKGPDPQQKNKYNIGRVKQFGEVWLTRVKQLIQMKCYSYREIGRMLNVDTNTIIKYSNIESHNIKPIKMTSQINSEYRFRWLSLQQQFPKQSRTELRKSDPRTYIWLYRNDRNWLNTNSPEIKKSTNHVLKIDWGKRDNEISEEIINAAVVIFSHNKPKRVTKSALGKLINKLSLLEKHINKLPKTSYILTEVTESIEEFQKRRIVWAAEQLRLRGESIKTWRIKKLAGLDGEISPGLVATIDLVINKCEPLFK